jgi:hypothetical protein
MLRTHRSLEAYCATCDEDDEVFFFFFSILMEHWWNEIDRGIPKYSEKNLPQYHFSHHKSHVD